MNRTLEYAQQNFTAGLIVLYTMKTIFHYISSKYSLVLNRERATPILSLCHVVFTDRFIFRHILEHFFPQKWKLRAVHECTRSIGYGNGKLKPIKK